MSTKVLIALKQRVNGVKSISGRQTFLIGEKTSDGYVTRGTKETSFKTINLTSDDIKRVYKYSDSIHTIILNDEIVMANKIGETFYELVTGIPVNISGAQAVVEEFWTAYSRPKISKKCSVTGEKKSASKLTIVAAGDGFAVVSGDSIVGKFYCKECKTYHLHENESTTSGVCKTCIVDMYKECGLCGKTHIKREMTVSQGYSMCPVCYAASSEKCRTCGKTQLRGINKYPDGGGGKYCDSCTAKKLDKPVQNYSFRPDPVFHGDSKVQMGFELEVELDGSEDRDDIARRVRDHGEGYFWNTSDSSIAYGFEMVSSPCDMEWFRSNEDWMKGHLEYMSSVGCEAMEKGHTSCGMHVHVSLEPWKRTQILNLFIFINKYKKNIIRLSGRTSESQISSYASFGDLSIKRLKKIVKKDSDAVNCVSRTSAIHLTGSTIEFRFFNSTLDGTRFYSNIEFVQSMFDYTLKTNNKNATYRNYIKFVKKNKFSYPNLNELLSSDISALDQSDEIFAIPALAGKSQAELKAVLESLLGVM